MVTIKQLARDILVVSIKQDGIPSHKKGIATYTRTLFGISVPFEKELTVSPLTVAPMVRYDGPRSDT
jgi:hypothetical protein